MLPTFVAPTGTMPKNPCRQRPRSATRSLSTNRFSARFATQGETENSSPARRHLASPRTKKKKPTLKMPPLLNHPCRRTVEPMIITRREIYHSKKESVAGLDPHRAAPRRARTTSECAARSQLLRNRGVVGDGVLHGLFRLDDGRIDPHTVLVRHGRRGRTSIRLWVRRELWRGHFLFSPRAGRDGRRGRGRTDELRKAVFYPVHVGEFAVVDDRHLPVWEMYGRRRVCRLPAYRSRPLDTEESVERVGYPFDLFDSSTLHGTKVEHGSIRGGDERSIGDGACARS